MKFYKLLEITEQDYIQTTEDEDYNNARISQSVSIVDNAVYIAVNEEDEDYVQVDLEYLDNLTAE